MIDPDSPLADPSRFSAPADSFGAIDPDSVAALAAAAADVALLVDSGGMVRDVAFATPDLAKDAYRGWIGRRWIDTVTVESRPKIDDLVRDARPGVATRWRQVNCPSSDGPDVPIRFCAIRFGADRRIVAVGRDLRAMAALQERLVEAQQAMEREYARIRGAEKRYRLLFQLASEAVVIVDAGTMRISEANPAASAALGRDPKRLVGQAFADLFDPASRQAAQSFVAALRVAPRVENVHLKPLGANEALLLSGALFRQEGAAHFLVLLSRLSGAPAAQEGADWPGVIDKMPEAFVVADVERRVIACNPAFLDLVQVATMEQARGEPLERWLGRAGIDVDALFASLRSHGSARNFSTIIRGALGSSEDVEVAASASREGARPCFGLAIRSVAPRSGRERLGGRKLPSTVEQFADLVGRVPLKNLVRETTDLIERLCIEAALDLTKDNRASAADMLGLSRQGFYTKLRRYGLGGLDGGGEAPN